MKMSMGQMGRRLLGFAVAGMALVTSTAAFAELGQPAPWEWKLQQAGSPVMEHIEWFHNILLVIITVITLFVLGLLDHRDGQVQLPRPTRSRRGPPITP